jgi:hypothetical protein
MPAFLSTPIYNRSGICRTPRHSVWENTILRWQLADETGPTLFFLHFVQYSSPISHCQAMFSKTLRRGGTRWSKEI